MLFSSIMTVNMTACGAMTSYGACDKPEIHQVSKWTHMKELSSRQQNDRNIKWKFKTCELFLKTVYIIQSGWKEYHFTFTTQYGLYSLYGTVNSG